MLILFPLIIFNLHATLIKHDVSSVSFKTFEYSEVCAEMGAKDSLLMTAKSQSEIECFNKSYSITNFCTKKFPADNSFTRGFIDKDKKRAVCEFGEGVMLTLGCDERDAAYCLRPKEGCEKLQKIYAHKMEMAHYSILEKKLNCYFTKPIGESLNEI